MNEFMLMYPTIQYKSQIEKYKQDMLNAESSMDGCGTLRVDNFEDWLQKCNEWREGKNLPEGFVQSSQYIWVRLSDNKIMGMLQIRHELSEYLLNYGGHIGDSIAVDERNKGYGKKLLALGIAICKDMGIDKVLIACKETNVASRKCILANGGKFEDVRQRPDGVKLERYWVDTTANS